MLSALLIDIGSTYTKVASFDLEEAELLARSQACTTVKEDINIGLKQALDRIPGWQQSDYRLACSSAAGGLRIAAIGLVPGLTAEAARRAALGAGSRVVKTYSYELTGGDITELEELAADIILLAGGTDGGNQEIILHNARLLADSRLEEPILVAGNRSAADRVADLLDKGKKEFYLTENVMPELEKLNIEPARELIRKIFLERIVKARGLDRVRELIDDIVMPTPAAVLSAADILARGSKKTEGWGELMVVDIGGATTDIHSAAAGTPARSGVSQRGLEEPFLKRTVEGDLGMRYCAAALFQLVKTRRWQELYLRLYNEELELENLESYVAKICQQSEYLPVNQREMELENMLGREAVRLAASRHAGSLRTIYTPQGASFIQEGKDLTEIKNVIGTGGIIVHNENPELVLAGVLQENQLEEEKLTPKNPDFYLDDDYLLAAAGLLAEVEADTALQIMEKYLRKIPREKERK